jgi:predicted NAD/FAD-dependent oxidoreductase
VLHGAPDWSRAQVEDSPESVTRTLLAALGDVVDGPLAELLWHQTHRWLFARSEEPLGAGCLWDGALGIGACGDWCADGRIEGAWLSGEALAGRVLAAID